MLDVREQATLPFRRMLDLCLDTISYRLFRSAVTVVIIVLAIAFLASIMVEGYLGRSVRDTVVGKTRQRTAYSRFMATASHVESEDALLPAINALQPGTIDYKNFMGWADLKTDDQAAALLARTRNAGRYLDFFEALSVGRRALLVRGRRGLAIFDWLAVPEHLQSFNDHLAKQRSLKLPGGPEDFRAFIAEWPSTRKLIEGYRARYQATVNRIAAFSGPGGVGAALAAAVAANRADAFFADVRAAGLHVDPKEVPDILAGMAYQKELNWALDQLRKQPVRATWNREWQESFSPTMALRVAADSPDRVDWIAGALAKGNQTDRAKWEKEKQKIIAKTPEGQTPKLPPEPKDWLEGFDAARFTRIAREYKAQAELLEAEQALLNRYGRTAGLSEKAVWLIIVSFVVCVVGIANAMLMSVLERFKEIATMKCLGARNGTIGFLFITESTIMGVIGGVIGMLVGFLIVLGRMSMVYGGMLYERFPFGNIWYSFLVCLACSLVLSAVAAIYPARVASRMAPMEAMRVD
jgi:putative ABC transport system permease protein